MPCLAETHKCSSRVLPLHIRSAIPLRSAFAQVGQRRRAHQQHSQRTRCACIEAEAGPDQLQGQDREDWDATVRLIEELGFAAPEAEKVVGRAFGWGSQVYWRNEKNHEVTEVKEYLGSLGLTDRDISKVVKEFNEVIACSVEGRLKANMAVLKEQWRMPEKAAVATVKRRPDTLGFVLDCQGDCQAECNRCWVRL